MQEISSKESLLHLAIAQQNKGKDIDFNRIYVDYSKKDIKELQMLSTLDRHKLRFEQCFVNESTKHYFYNVPVEKLYAKYHKAEWGDGKIILLAKSHFINNKKEDVYNIIYENIYGDKINPRVVVIKLENEDKYNVLDGMHRVTRFLQSGKESVPCVVIVVKKDFV